MQVSKMVTLHHPVWASKVQTWAQDIQDIQGLQDYIGNQLLKYSLDGVEALEKSYKQNGSDGRRDDSSLKEGPILP